MSFPVGLDGGGAALAVSCQASATEAFSALTAKTLIAGADTHVNVSLAVKLASTPPLHVFAQVINLFGLGQNLSFLSSSNPPEIHVGRLGQLPLKKWTAKSGWQTITIRMSVAAGNATVNISYAGENFDTQIIGVGLYPRAVQLGPYFNSDAGTAEDVFDDVQFCY